MGTTQSEMEAQAELLAKVAAYSPEEENSRNNARPGLRECKSCGQVITFAPSKWATEKKDRDGQVLTGPDGKPVMEYKFYPRDVRILPDGTLRVLKGGHACPNRQAPQAEGK